MQTISKDRCLNDKQVKHLIKQNSKALYVYALIDPRNFNIRYIGKGSGNRCLVHFYQDMTSNFYKQRWLNTLANKGTMPLYYIYQFFQKEKTAYKYEESLITKLGRVKDKSGQLYNLSLGSFNDKRRVTTEELLKKLKAKHSNLYSYPPSFKYFHKNMYSEIPIICKIHKRFTQTANSHLSGKGCPKCAISYRTQLFLKTTKQFILEAEIIHGDLYSYNKSVYKGSDEKLDIYCKIHKSYFSQQANSHLGGQGCPKCGTKKSSSSRMKTTKEFIEELSSLLPKKYYNYKDIVYKGVDELVYILCIRCNKVFHKKPRHLRRGQGCPNCRSY